MTTLDYAIRPARSRRRWLAVNRTGERAEAGALRLAPRAAARGVALFFGAFALFNLIGELRIHGFDENVWWLDLRPLPATPSALLLGLAGALLVWWALRPATPGRRRTATLVALGAMSLAAVWNGVAFYRVWAAGEIRPWLPLPFSFVLAAALLFVAWAVARPAPLRRSRRTPVLIVATLLLCGVLFPLAQQGFFGKTTYVRPVQVAVVFGAQVHGDGHPSTSLVDRVRTAAGLYKAGLAQRLLLSGAQGVGEPANETTVMRSLAMGFGVPDSAIDPRPDRVQHRLHGARHRARAARRRRPFARGRQRLLPPAAREARLPARRVRRRHGAVAGAPHPADHAARAA